MDDKNYYNQLIWEHKDDVITSNILKISLNLSKNNYGCTPLSLSFNIVNYKSKLYTNFIMDVQKTNLYIDKFKTIYQDTIKIKNELTNSNLSKTFIVKDFRKITSTILFRSEFKDICTRISIGESNREVIDADSCFIDFNSYLSMIKIIENFKEQFLTISSSFYNSILLIDIMNELKQHKQDFRINNQSQIKSENNYNNNCNSLLTTEKNEVPLIDNEVTNVINDMTHFLSDNLDKMDIGLQEIKQYEDSEPKLVNKVTDNEFTSKVISNNASELETLLINCINTPIPFRKFIDRIESKIENTLNIDNIEIIEFLTTNFLKFYINSHLEKKQKLPVMTIPVYSNSSSSNLTNISIMYDLFVYFCYYNILRTSLSEKDHNTTNNRTLHSFILKNLASPLIFSYCTNIERDIIISSVERRFYTYYQQGVFKEVEDSIYKLYKYKPDINNLAIKKELCNNLDSFEKIKNKYNLELAYNNFLSKKIISLPYKLFIQSSFSNEQIIKLTTLDFYETKKQKIDLDILEKNHNIKDLSDIPQNILDFYKVTKKKVDNSNLIRYVTQNFKDDKRLQEYLKICEKIIVSYRDLKNEKINFVNLPELLLKTIYLWDTELDAKIKNNFIYYSNLIKNSTLNHSMLLSLLNNIDDRTTTNFVEIINSIHEIGV